MDVKIEYKRYGKNIQKTKGKTHRDLEISREILGLEETVREMRVAYKITENKQANVTTVNRIQPLKMCISTVY